MPLVNPTIEVGGRWIRPDCLWPHARLIVELDGRAAHAAEIGFEQDRERDADLLAAGYRAMRITRRRFERAPGRVERALRDALAGRIVAAA
jgi:very-short-patch-repair endonuclease